MNYSDELTTPEPVLLEFEKVRLFRAPDWPKNWLGAGTRPGDILLLEGPWGTTDGLLRLTSHGAFVNINPEQIFESAMISWPSRTIDGIRIVDSLVQVIPKKNALPVASQES